MMTEIAVARMRRSLRLSLVGALIETTIPVVEVFRAGRPRVLIVSGVCAVILWAVFFVRRRAFRAVIEGRTTNVRSI